MAMISFLYSPIQSDPIREHFPAPNLIPSLQETCSPKSPKECVQALTFSTQWMLGPINSCLPQVAGENRQEKTGLIVFDHLPRRICSVSPSELLSSRLSEINAHRQHLFPTLR